jgi:predicted dehydrogenase
MSRLRAAVVGVGYLGAYHAEKYAAHPEVDLVAVVDVDAGRAAAVADRLGAAAYPDAAALAGRVDCASVAVPTPQHHAIARVLLESGIDVLVEKPLTTSVAEGQELLECAARGKRVLQVGHLERFNPAIQAIADQIHAPRFVESQRLAPFGDRGTDVDVVLDLMIHDLDLLLATVGSPVRSVDAVGIPVLTSSVDIANARLRFANGCVANVTASRVSVKRERKLRIFQSDAYFSVDFDERRVRIVRRESQADGPPRLHFEEIVVEPGDALAAELHAFVEAVRRRETPPVSGWDGLKALEVAEVIRESVETEVRAAQAESSAS